MKDNQGGGKDQHPPQRFGTHVESFSLSCYCNTPIISRSNLIFLKGASTFYQKSKYCPNQLFWPVNFSKHLILFLMCICVRVLYFCLSVFGKPERPFGEPQKVAPLVLLQIDQKTLIGNGKFCLTYSPISFHDHGVLTIIVSIKCLL